MKSLELFAGGGGLALGLHLAGFNAEHVVEWDKWSCDTIRHNQMLGYPLVQGWAVHQLDAREFDFNSIGDVDLVSGGPPCQPFSLGGKHKGYNDERDMFPTAVKAVRQLRPRAFIFENVKGITRPSFANYFRYILLQLTFPEAKSRQGESWERHLNRLEQFRKSERHTGLEYNVDTQVLNAADYGIPQRRERVFFVGFRSDTGLRWSSPAPTHSYEALLRDQFSTHNYWKHHGLRPAVMEAQRKRVGKELARKIDQPRAYLLPWRTVRDALVGLPDPRAFFV